MTIEEKIRLVLARINERSEMSGELVSEHKDPESKAHHQGQHEAYGHAAKVVAELLG